MLSNLRIETIEATLKFTDIICYTLLLQYTLCHRQRRPFYLRTPQIEVKRELMFRIAGSLSWFTQAVFVNRWTISALKLYICTLRAWTKYSQWIEGEVKDVLYNQDEW